MKDFVHLHLHTEYSLLDGFCPLEELVIAAKNLGMTSLAITDHGVMFGVVDFYKLCHKHGLRPILGCEVYVATDNPRVNHHLVLLAKDNEGYKNLMELVSLSFTHHFYYRPRITKELLEKHHGGLIALSSCLQGEVSQMLLQGRDEDARRVVEEYRALFGEDYYVELQDHGLSEQKRILPKLLRLHESTGVPLVATNDVHYIQKEDYLAQDVLLCIQTGKEFKDKERMRFPSREFYLKDGQEMEELFSAYPGALENTMQIAEKCHVTIDFSNFHVAPFHNEEGLSSKEYLRKICFEGLEKLYGHDDYVKRLEEELAIIDSMGYNDFFLIVADIVNYARKKGIFVGPGRGSGGGSLAAYCLGIHKVDPMKYGLLFERFLNAQRVTMPDFDIDFEDERRGEVLEYIFQHYGADHVAQIVTFGTFGARQALRDVGRVFSMNYAEVDRVAKAIPSTLGMTLTRGIRESEHLRELMKKEEVAYLVDMALRIEGRPRHCSVHAAGVVMSGAPLRQIVPLYLQEGVVVTQYNMTLLEELGLLKIDVLGLRNLSIIKHALNLIQYNQSIEMDIDAIPVDDEPTFTLLQSADTLGIFQLESPGMRNFFKELKPTSIEDIIAGISLYRPGPMEKIPVYIRNKHNPEKIRYAHPCLEPILGVTYGVMVYQEQVMEMVRALAGYSYNQADIIRRAMSKKKMEVMEREKQTFLYGDGKTIHGAIKKGLTEKEALDIYNSMTEFANYAFNKSHATGYALIAYQTAYLKTHYPVEFMAALMSSVMGSSVKLASYMEASRSMGIDILPPNINHSLSGFSTEEGKIRFGLRAIKNVGSTLIDALLAARKSGSFHSFEDLLQRLSAGSLNKRAFESMIKAGALDGLGETRRSLLQRYEVEIDSIQRGQRMSAHGQISLFDELIPTQSHALDLKEYEKDQLLTYEKEVLGMYLSGHPLSKYKALRQGKMMNLAALAELTEEEGDGKQVKLLLMKKLITRKMTKKAEDMAFVEMEDEMDSIEVIFFPRTYKDYKALLEKDQFFLVEGRLQMREDQKASVICEKLQSLEAIPQAKEILYIKVKHFDEETMDTIHELMEANPGPHALRVYAEQKKELREIKSRTVALNPVLLQELRRLFGENSVVIK